MGVAVEMQDDFVAFWYYGCDGDPESDLSPLGPEFFMKDERPSGSDDLVLAESRSDCLSPAVLACSGLRA